MLRPLLGKLYESYKRDIIQGIRHDEQEYRKKVDEIKEIEEGKWGDNELLREMGREQQVLEIQRLQLLRQMRLEMAQKQLRLEKRGGLNYHANSSQPHQTPNQATAQTSSSSPNTPTKTTGAIAATRSLSPERNVTTKIDQQKEERSKSESPTLTAASQNTKALQHQQLQQQLQQHKLQQLQQQQLQKQQLIQQQLKQQQQQKVLQLQQALAQAQKVKTEQKPEEKTQEEVKQFKPPVEPESAKSTQEKKPASVVKITKESKLVQEAAANVIDKSEPKNNDDLELGVVESTPKNDGPAEPTADAKPETSIDSKSDSKQPELPTQQADKETGKLVNSNTVKSTEETQLLSTQKEVKFAENLEEVKTLPEDVSEEKVFRSGKVKENNVNKEEDKATDKEEEEQPTEQDEKLEPSDERANVVEKSMEVDIKVTDESEKVEKEIITEPDKLATETLTTKPSANKSEEVDNETFDTEKDTGSSTEPEESEKSESAPINKNHAITEIPESFTDSAEVEISKPPKLQEPEKSDDIACLADEKEKPLEESKEAEPVEESPKEVISNIRKDESTVSTKATDDTLKAEKSEEVDKDVDQAEDIEAEEEKQEKTGMPVTDFSESEEEKEETKTEVDFEQPAKPEEPEKPESLEVSGDSEEPEATNEEEEEQKPVPEPRVTRSTAKTLDKEAVRPTVRTRSSSRVRNKTPEVKEEKPTKKENEEEEQSEEEVQQEKEVNTEGEFSEPEEPEPKPKGAKRAAVEKRESARLKKAKLEESVEKTTQADHSASEKSEAEDAASDEDQEDVKINDEEKEEEAEEEEEQDHDKEPEEEEDEEAENDESPGPPTKRTRSMSSAKKRKRQSSPPRSTPNRRFLTMVNPLLSNISSNKSASFFSNPVNPNDAPNYYDLIYYPTDIRTIKAQVKEGRIRDTAELERQLQRMFANAVMYNGWDSDVSVWTREMQHDTETLLALFRGAERTSAVNSEKGSMASGDEDSSKRRKK